MKTLGILGGVGPQTTSEVYLSIIDLIKERGADEYPSILIYNMPFPLIIEDEVIVQGVNSEKMIPFLVEGAKILEKSGVDIGILPCNTLHKYMKEIRASVKFPFLSILEETALVLKSKKVSCVGILATETTIRSNIYGEELISDGVEALYPSKKEQEIINKIILDLLSGEKTLIQKENLEKICSSLHERGAQVILLACTDLQLVTQNLVSPVLVIDTTEILINFAVREIEPLGR